MKALVRLQNIGANRGWWQYPIPRRMPHRARADNIGLRLVFGILGLFGVIVFGAAVIAIAWVIGVFIYAAATT